MDATLSYEPSKPRKWKLPRILIALCFAVILILAGLKVAPEFMRRSRMLYHQQRLLHSAPGSSAAFAYFPSNGAATQTSGPVGTASGTAVGSLSYTSDWTQYRAANLSPVPFGAYPVYVHSISDRHGQELLVAVQIPIPGSNGAPQLWAEVYTPGSWLSYPSVAPVVVWPFQFDFDINRLLSSRFTIFPGQPDPSDASHFTIDYDLNGQRHTLDGYINEQDVLTIEKRKE